MTKANLAGNLPTNCGITPKVATEMWSALGKEYVVVGVVQVSKRTEPADSDTEPSLVLKVVDLEIAKDDTDDEALRRAVKALYRARTAEGTLDEVNPRDPADGMSAAEIVDNGSTLGARGAALPDEDDAGDQAAEDGTDEAWEYEQPDPQPTADDDETVPAGVT